MRLDAARRDWLQQLRLVCSVMLIIIIIIIMFYLRHGGSNTEHTNRKYTTAMAVQDLCKSCRVRVILFYFIANERTALQCDIFCYRATVSSFLQRVLN